MKSLRYFVFLYVEDPVLSNMLNTAILALNPSDRWPAHITLAGPYETRRSVPRNLEFSHRVSVIGVNQFRTDTQNTVHFRVGAHGMKDVWRKPDYPYNPHMTIYDGPNHSLGDELFHQLQQLRPIFKFEVTKLNIVASGAQRDFNLLAHVDTSFSPILHDMGLEDLRNLTDDDRIFVAIEAIRRAVMYCAQFR